MWGRRCSKVPGLESQSALTDATCAAGAEPLNLAVDLTARQGIVVLVGQ
jgi:hypothetical protein